MLCWSPCWYTVLKLFSLTSVAIICVAANDAADSAASVTVSYCWWGPVLVIKNPPLSKSNAMLASLLSSNSSITESISVMSSSINWGNVAILRGFAIGIGDEFVEQEPGDHVEGLENAFALVRGSGERGHLCLAIVEEKIHVLDRSDVGQITFVVLNDVRDLVQIHVEGTEVLLKVGEALHVFFHFLVLRIRDEHEAIHAAQDELARGVVNDLARNGVK